MDDEMKEEELLRKLSASYEDHWKKIQQASVGNNVSDLGFQQQR